MAGVGFPGQPVVPGGEPAGEGAGAELPGETGVAGAGVEQWFVIDLYPGEDMRFCAMELQGGGVWLAEVMHGGAFHRAGVPRGFVGAVNDAQVWDLASLSAALLTVRDELDHTGQAVQFELAVTPLVDPSGDPGAEDWPLAERPLFYQVAKAGPDDPMGLCAMGLAAGIWIGDVAEGSACWRAGVPRGLLVGINGQELRDVYEMEDYILTQMGQGVNEFELQVYEHIPVDQRAEAASGSKASEVVVYVDDGAMNSFGLPLATEPLTFTVEKFTSVEDLRFCALQLAIGGVWLAEALPGGPMARAGVCRGMLLSINGVPVATMVELQQAMARLVRADFKVCVLPTFADEQRRLAEEGADPTNSPILRGVKDESVFRDVLSTAPAKFKAMADPTRPEAGVRIVHVNPKGTFGRHGVPCGKLVAIRWEGMEQPIASIADIRNVLAHIREENIQRFNVEVYPFMPLTGEVPSLVGPRARRGPMAVPMLDDDARSVVSSAPSRTYGAVSSPIGARAGLHRLPNSPNGIAAPIPIMTFPPPSGARRTIAGGPSYPPFSAGQRSAPPSLLGVTSPQGSGRPRPGALAARPALSSV
eukprot:TRINITY_DN17627_c0_g1_i1.p1 TRINITY_DN17627_c0_g1~~TRINITY_DN17627_c0_g1_i1.p1  ORF type:complete len:588 (+),score=128.43 TRINITY_DN17627_c0_g1_i1:110-1873(+)